MERVKRARKGAPKTKAAGSQEVPVVTLDFTMACVIQEAPSHEHNKDQLQRLVGWLRGKTKDYVFQQERGEGGFLHLQGRVHMLSKTRPSGAFNSYEEVGFITTEEGARLSVRFSATSSHVHVGGKFSYVMKEDTRVNGPWSSRSSNVPWQIKPIIEHGLWEWQEEVENSHDYPHPREINLVVDPPGNMGKSTYATWLIWSRRGVVLPPMSNGEQMVMAAMSLLRGEKRTKLLIDIPRGLTDIEEPTGYLPWGKKGKGKGQPNFFLEKRKETLKQIFLAIEQVKSGILHDPRHSFRQTVIPSPTVWVFVNHDINRRFLSADRWRIFRPRAGDNHRFEPRPDGTKWFPKRTTPVLEDATDFWANTDVAMPIAAGLFVPVDDPAPVDPAPMDPAAANPLELEDLLAGIPPEELDAWNGGLDEADV